MPRAGGVFRTLVGVLRRLVAPRRPAQPRSLPPAWVGPAMWARGYTAEDV